MKKSTKIIIGVIILFFVIIGGVVFTLLNNGFTFLTYSTENKVDKQLESILSNEGETDYSGKVEKIALKEISNNYLGFFKVKDSEIGEYIIVNYDDKGKFGKNKIVNLNRIVKGDNSVVMVDIPIVESVTSRENHKFVILSGLDKEKYSGINIVDKSTEKVLAEIDLNSEDVQNCTIIKLDNDHIVYEYIPDSPTEVKVELVMKSN